MKKANMQCEGDTACGHFPRLSLTMRLFLMPVMTRARCAFHATPGYLPRVGNWSHAQTKAKKTQECCVSFDCKNGADDFPLGQRSNLRAPSGQCQGRRRSLV